MARPIPYSRATLTLALVALTATFQVRASVATPPTLVQRLVAVAVAGDLLGSSVALSDDQLVLGAPGDDEIAADSGAAHVYRQLGGAWVFEQELVASDGTANQSFGHSVSSGPNTVVVGTPLDDDSGTDAGAVYVYNLVNGLWFQQQKLVAADGAAGDQLGYSVALEDGRVLAGAPMNDGAGSNAGAAYTFVEAGGVWVQEQKITASNAAANDHFGYSVAIVPGQALIGAPGSDAAVVDGGAAYTLALVGGAWVEDQMLVGADASVGDALGTAVATVPDAALVGAPMADNGAADDSGAAYYYERDTGIWFERQKIQPTGPATDDHFGDSVGLSGSFTNTGGHAPWTLAAFGLPGRDDTVVDVGSVQLFGAKGGTFDPIEEVFSSFPTAMAAFGTSVAADGPNVLVGAPMSDLDGVVDLGSGWALEFAGPPRPTGLKASAASPDTIALQWTDNSATETSFDVLRKIPGAGGFQNIATLPADVNSYVDAGLAGDTKHCYRVLAVSAFGVGRSNRSCAKTESGAPNKPRKLRAKAVSSTQIDLTWRDRSDDEDQFVILRKEPGGAFAEHATTAANATSFSDTSAAPGTKYCYRVQAENVVGVSRPSNRSCATTDP